MVIPVVLKLYQLANSWSTPQSVGAITDEYGLLYYELPGILAFHDPMRLISGGSRDTEYAREARRLLSYLNLAATVEQAEVLIGAVFIDAFRKTLGAERLRPIAHDVWDAWIRHKARTSGSRK